MPYSEARRLRNGVTHLSQPIQAVRQLSSAEALPILWPGSVTQDSILGICLEEEVARGTTLCLLTTKHHPPGLRETSKIGDLVLITTYWSDWSYLPEIMWLATKQEVVSAIKSMYGIQLLGRQFKSSNV